MSFEVLGPGKFPECHACPERLSRLSKVPPQIKDGDYLATTTLVVFTCTPLSPGSSFMNMGGTIRMRTSFGESSTQMDIRAANCPGLERESN
ncbi:MAG: hypothetical protein WBO77_00345 [Microgenomates group bacterium]